MAETRQSSDKAGNTDTRGRGIPRYVTGLLCAVGFVAAALLLAFFYVRVFMPFRYVKVEEPDRSYRPTAMQHAVAPSQVRKQLDSIVDYGSRMLGQPGMYQTADHIRRAYEAAGLEMYEHDIQSVASHTKYREIYLADTATDSLPYGRPISEVEIYPFMANYLQPVVTPDTGMTGTLVLLNAETLRNRESFENCIGLIDSREGAFDDAYGFEWTRYAKLGIKALVISHREGFEVAPWPLIANRFGGLLADVPVNYPRVAATKEIFQYLGEKIRLRVRADFKPTKNTTLFGVMRAPQPAREAVVIATKYDGYSILPDRTPAVMQAVSPALQLQVLKGLESYREHLRRDVIFVAFGSDIMANDGLHKLLRVLGWNSKSADVNRLLKALGVERKEQKQGSRMKPIVEWRAGNTDTLAILDTLRGLFKSPPFLVKEEATKEALDRLPGKMQGFFEDQYRYVLNSIVLELSGPMLQAKVAFERSGKVSVESEDFATYLEAKHRYDAATSAAGFSAHNLLDKKAEFAREYHIRKSCLARIQELREHHRRLDHRLQQEAELIRVFDRYQDFAVVEFNLVPPYTSAEEDEVITLDVGGRYAERALPSIASLIPSARQRLGLADEVQYIFPDRESRSRLLRNLDLVHLEGRRSSYWTVLGYPVYSVTSLSRTESLRHYGDPTDLPKMHDVENLRASFAVAAEAVLSMIHGNGKIHPVGISEYQDRTYAGQVLVSNVGQSIVPNYPLENALVTGRPYEEKAMFARPGYYDHLIVSTDPYGRFYLPHCVADFTVSWREYGKGYNPVAVGFSDNGLVSFIKDEGEDGQRLFKSVDLPRKLNSEVTIVTFRSSPVTVLDLTNPQTMKDYSGVQMIDRDGLTKFRKYCPFADKGLQTVFLRPDEHFYVQLQSGAPDNELVQMTRAFMLGIDDPQTYESEREIAGPGYLVADNEFLLNIPHEVAKSMAFVNNNRVELQQEYDMVDEQIEEYHQKTFALLDRSEADTLTQREAELVARDAVTYATLNHPVLRDSIFEAVVGILWYLGLLVPFVFFFEKLLFCYPDVRKQLAAEAVIFVTVFTLLRILHPAFQMVRSSLMILLGFIIILISGGITLLFSGKFQENLEELRKKAGRVEGAEVNTLGVMASAFMLGLNNMHRRKMRTGLTCATLTLLTFVMICFTSVQNEIVEEETAIGRATYQGMLVKREMFLPVTEAEVFALREKYGESYNICERRVLIGRQNTGTKQADNPELEAVYTSEQGIERRVEFQSVIQLNHNEPLQDQLEFTAGGKWFTPMQDEESQEVCPVFLPDRMADQLGVSPTDVEQGAAFVAINGTRFVVQGIFSSRSLEMMEGLDGKNLLPFDVESMATVDRVQGNVVAREDDPRIPAHEIVITPVRALFKNVPQSRERIISAVVSMPGTGYRQAREDIETYLEQTGQAVYYGLDEVAYRGRRTRAMTLAGMIDLLIPLILAGLTVLNTMRGSVYERREEIFVYNAVGIAPKYVFFMFMAESFVYAVVGSILGYLLSQGTGRILTMLELTGGLNMTFTSISTIYASLTIAGAVFFSTYFPARQAMEISAPAEESGWDLPEPEEDELEFDLPFNFSIKGRIAVLAFFDRYLRDHGEGSAGRFFAAEPEITVGSEDDGADTTLIPEILTTIWLKPFDLAVSQRMTIAMPPDPETGQYKARIQLHRISGTRESWMRLNKGFVTLVRRHFLHWRAVSPSERDEMFVEARKMLEDKYKAETIQA